MPSKKLDKYWKVKSSLMSKDDLDSIHWATLEVMENTGIKIHSQKSLKILDDSGAHVDYKKNIAKIPSHLVEEALRKAPKHIRLHARNPKFDIKLDGKHVYISTDGIGIATIDFETGEKRSSTKNDVATTATIADALEDLHIYWPMVVATDVPQQAHVLHELEASLNNTEKPITLNSTSKLEEAVYLVKMLAAAVGGEEELRKRPIAHAFECTVSPLILDGGSTDAALEFSKAGLPIAFMGMPHAGMTAPITLAGTMVINNAEVLSSFTIIEMADPGAPIMYSAVPSMPDLRTGQYGAGIPESALLFAAGAQMARYYGIPSMVGGFGPDAKIPGAQAAYESVFYALTPALVGADILCGIGLLDGDTLLSLEQLLIDYEIGTILLRLIRGFDVNDETLALDLINKVGPGGNYLIEKHTVEHVHECWRPMISFSSSYGAWKTEGSRDVAQVAREKVKEILATHKPVPLDANVKSKVRQIVSEGEKKIPL
ncbi:MAG: trimethylamine methyltransferase family protein [Candidatus Bathyarchaeota archaeon]|jgi:trimethylamine--corrinoid protein Co-methyltransferase